ncbi:hypothetical protein FRC98_10975 [Lujinxingia vulgaris]|uniref:Beta-hydroxyacyl-ACP dehydratase n=1 Tax=Lujinxingia vulgaris TaxID=2600176 RepID=A0A5C6XI87_9DELT|nr:hypothetical protein [Lujinxingia vulgaris]TXD37245.1 hypothetical protein FRC98_10975 [Lujinxingia vulgaris]
MSETTIDLSDAGISKTLRRLRRRPLVEPEGWPLGVGGEALEGRALVESLLPQRGPMLLVDELVGVDLQKRLALGRRLIGEDHVGLEGHFPDDPVLPGVLLIEMMGQAGLCLYTLLLRQELPEEAAELQVRATKILGAHFVREVRPGDSVELLVQATRFDTMLGECVAQALVDGEVVGVMAGEVTVF